MQWPVVNTLSQEMTKQHNQEDGSREIPKLDPCWKSYLHGKHRVEIRIMSLNRDNTDSWVRISHGSNKFVMDLNNNDTEIPEDQLEDQALQLDAKDFVKAKSQRREPADPSSRIVPMDRRNWIDIEPGKYSLSEYEVSRK